MGNGNVSIFSALAEFLADIAAVNAALFLHFAVLLRFNRLDAF